MEGYDNGQLEIDLHAPIEICLSTNAVDPCRLRRKCVMAQKAAMTPSMWLYYFLCGSKKIIFCLLATIVPGRKGSANRWR